MRCRACGEEGEVTVQSVANGKAAILDFIRHKPTCTLAPPVMPAHLRSRSWEKHERRTSARLGIHGTLASGSVGMDGDGRTFQRWRLECKQTAGDQYTLTQATWTKLVDGALRAGEEPVLDIEYTASRGARRRRVVVREALWASFHGAVEPRAPATRWHVPATGASPTYVGLVPPGIAIDESDFLPIKEQLDAQLP